MRALIAARFPPWVKNWHPSRERTRTTNAPGRRGRVFFTTVRTRHTARVEITNEQVRSRNVRAQARQVTAQHMSVRRSVARRTRTGKAAPPPGFHLQTHGAADNGIRMRCASGFRRKRRKT